MARLRPNAPMPNNWLRISSVKPITLTSNNCNLSATTVVNMKAHVHSELTEPKKNDLCGIHDIMRMPRESFFIGHFPF